MYIERDFSNFMFSAFPVIFSLLFIIVIAFIIITAVKGISQWSQNNKQPILIVSAKVITKRTKVSNTTHHTSDTISHHHSSTSYYITFEVESGSRLEFNVDGSEYGMLAEEDHGKLKFQGTRYLGFEREQ